MSRKTDCVQYINCVGINSERKPTMSDFFKKYAPSILAVISVIVTAAAPQIQAFVSSHPTFTSFVFGVSAIFAHFYPSPIKGN